MNLANKAGSPVAEQGERRAGTEGNADQQRTRRAQDRESVSHALDRIRQAARHRTKEKFTALFHHINPESLRTAFYALKRDAAPGVDGQTWRTYEADLDQRIADLHGRVQRGAYRALPSRRTYIPKPDGRQRPLTVGTITSNCTTLQPAFGFGGSNPSLSSAARSTFRGAQGPSCLRRGDLEPASS